jgi:hypothetical protein
MQGYRMEYETWKWKVERGLGAALPVAEQSTCLKVIRRPTSHSIMSERSEKEKRGVRPQTLRVEPISHS